MISGLLQGARIALVLSAPLREARKNPRKTACHPDLPGRRKSMFQVRSGNTLQIAEVVQIWLVLLNVQHRETVCH